jgi:hypothetical protein
VGGEASGPALSTRGEDLRGLYHALNLVNLHLLRDCQPDWRK